MPYIQRPLESSSAGATIVGKNIPSLRHHALAEDPRPFNVLYHETEIHVPQPVLNIAQDSTFDGKIPDCLDMPIRMKGDSEYHIPEEWVQLIPSLSHIINVEHSNNSAWQDYYTYLSVHYTPDLVVGEQQRHAGCHTDGFQGVRVPERTRTSRSYVAVTNGGTRFFPQTFVANLDASRFNIFEGFDLQVRKNEDGSAQFGIAEEKMFYFFDAYTVHETGAAARDGERLFVRLTWEQKLFDRAENTRNRMLSYDWKPVEYDIRSSLKTPTVEDIEAARLVRNA